MFSCEYCNFLRRPILKNICKRQTLYFSVNLKAKSLQLYKNMNFFTGYFDRQFKHFGWFFVKFLEQLSRQNASSCYCYKWHKYSLSSFPSSWTRQWCSPDSSHFLNMFCTQDLGEARFNNLRRELHFLRLLKRWSKRIHLPEKH